MRNSEQWTCIRTTCMSCRDVHDYQIIGWHQNVQPAAQLIGYQLTAEEEEVDQRKPECQIIEV